MGFSVLDINGGEKVTLGQSAFTTTATGNVDDLDFGNADLIRFNNSSLATLRGLKAGADGQRVVIVSIGAGQVNLSHQDTGDGTAANRLLNFVTGGVTPLAAGVGTCIYEYDGAVARWRLITHDQGASIDVAFSAGNFTGNGSMTVTVDPGDQVTFSYFLHDRVISVSVVLNFITIGGTPNTEILIAIPLGLVAATTLLAPIVLFNNGTEQISIIESIATTSQLVVALIPLANFAASTNNTSFYAQISFPVS